MLIGALAARKTSLDLIIESADAGIELIVCITEGIPTLDMVTVSRALEGRGVPGHPVPPRSGPGGAPRRA